MTSFKNYKLDVFISGELVDLSIPTSDFAENSNWYSWFNDKDLTKFLEQGLYTNSRKSQLEYFKNITSDRLVFIIVDKEGRNIGVISLSFINHSKKSCDIALVVSNEGDKRLRPYISLEAMALITTHAFNILAIERINAGQHISLAGWQRRLELLGYQLEGFHRNKFKKNREVADSISIAVCKEDYDAICKKRNGNLWDSLIEMKRRIKNLPRQTYLSMLQDIYNKERKKYYDNIFNL
jgi:RimJ/RimL family protein N-acetyltransferase